MEYIIKLTESYEVYLGSDHATKRFREISQVLRFFDIQISTGRKVTGINVSGVEGRAIEAERLEKQLNRVYKTQVI